MIKQDKGAAASWVLVIVAKTITSSLQGWLVKNAPLVDYINVTDMTLLKCLQDN